MGYVRQRGAGTLGTIRKAQGSMETITTTADFARLMAPILVPALLAFTVGGLLVRSILRG